MPIRLGAAHSGSGPLLIFLLMCVTALAIELPPIEVPIESPIAPKKKAGSGAGEPGTLIVIDGSYASVTVVPRSEIELEQSYRPF